MSINHKKTIDIKQLMKSISLETSSNNDKTANSVIISKSKSIRKNGDNTSNINDQLFEIKNDKNSNKTIPKKEKEKEKSISKPDQQNRISNPNYLTFGLTNNNNNINSEFERFHIQANTMQPKGFKQNLCNKNPEFIPLREDLKRLLALEEDSDRSDEKNKTKDNMKIDINMNDININSNVEKDNFNKNLSNIDNNNDFNKFEDKYINNEFINDINNLNDFYDDETDKIKKILNSKEKTFENEYISKFSYIYTTTVYFKKDNYSKNKNNYIESILLLKKNKLYILKKNSHIPKKFINPEESLLYDLRNFDILYLENYANLETDYDLSCPLLCINFNLLSCILLNNKIDKDEFEIMILGNPPYKCSIKIFNKEIKQKFLYLIGNLIHNTQGYKSNILGLSLRTNNYYKDTYINNSEFESMAKTGDILLFRTIDCASDCQRFFTRDTYDHIGILVRNYNEMYNDLCLYEATSVGKCKLLKWDNFKKYLFNLVYKRVTYRKLNIGYKDKNEIKKIQKNIQEITNEFITETWEKDYVLSIPKILFCKKKSEYEIKGDWGNAEGFCCSALTAAFFIKIGAIKIEKTVHSIVPGDFEQDRNCCKFINGFSLGPEKIIEFSQ